jgi:hypothetical protein
VTGALVLPKYAVADRSDSPKFVPVNVMIALPRVGALAGKIALTTAASMVNGIISELAPTAVLFDPSWLPEVMHSIAVVDRYVA